MALVEMQALALLSALPMQVIVVPMFTFPDKRAFLPLQLPTPDKG